MRYRRDRKQPTFISLILRNVGIIVSILYILRKASLVSIDRLSYASEESPAAFSINSLPKTPFFALAISNGLSLKNPTHRLSSVLWHATMDGTPSLAASRTVVPMPRYSHASLRCTLISSGVDWPISSIDGLAYSGQDSIARLSLGISCPNVIILRRKSRYFLFSFGKSLTRPRR